MSSASPLQAAPELRPDGRVFLKREDLLQPGGGNKVARFDAFFARHGRVRTVVALSNPGAHSLYVLSHYLTGPERESGADRLVFLERRMPLDPYFAALRQSYLHNPRIEVSRRPLWIQLFLFTLYRWFGRLVGARTIGIGGHLQQRPNPYLPAMEKCVQQLQQQAVTGPVVHLFAVASGDMADGLLQYVEAHPELDHRLVGVMTGPVATRPRLRFRYRRRSRLKLVQARPMNRRGYERTAETFYARTAVWIDPLHTAQIVRPALLSETGKGATLVLWMTQPFIEAPPELSTSGFAQVGLEAKAA